MKQAYFYAFGTFITLMAGVLTNVLIGRFLGVGVYGLYSIGRTLGQFILLGAALGMDLGLQRWLPDGLHNGWPVVPLLRVARLISLSVSAIVTALLLAGGARLVERIYAAPGLAEVLLWSVLAVPFIVDAALVFAVGRVLGNLKPYTASILFGQPVLRSFLVAGVFYCDGDLIAILIAIDVAVVVSWIVYISFEARLCDPAHSTTRAGNSFRRLREFMGTSIWLGASSFFVGVTKIADMMILALFVTLPEVGVYAAMSFVAQTVQSLTVAVSQGLGAKVAKAAAKGDQATILETIDEASRQAIPLSLFLFGGISAFGQDLHVIFGPEFVVNEVTVFFLSAGYLTSGVLSIVGYALSMAGRHREESTLITIGGVAMLISVALGAWLGGGVGTAVAAFVATMGINLTRTLYVAHIYRRLPAAPKLLMLGVPAWLLGHITRWTTIGIASDPRVAFIVGAAAYTTVFALVLSISQKRGESSKADAGTPKRVAVLSFHFAEYTARLVDALDRNHRVLMVGSRRKLQKEAPQGLARRILGRQNNVWYYDRFAFTKILSASWIVFSVIRFRPTMIIAHESPVPIPALLIAVFGLFYPLRLIIHDPEPHSGKDAEAAHRGARWLAVERRTAAMHVVHGRYCKQALMRVYGPGIPILEIEHGTLLEPMAEERGSPHPTNALFFGRLERYKGLPVLFAAADQLVERIPGFTLTIIGHGSEVASVAAFAATRPWVHWRPGYASAEEVIRSFQMCRVVILPYDEGTQSGVLAAAMSNGRPVVSTTVGALSEIVNDSNGFLVSPGDVDAVVRSVSYLLTDDIAWTRACAGAQLTAETVMNWDCIATRLVAESAEVAP